MDFVQEAKARHGKDIHDAEISETRKGEKRVTKIGISPLGKSTKTVVVS